MESDQPAPMLPLDRIRWAVEFAQLDLPALRAGDRLNLQEDLARFLVAERGGEVPGVALPGTSAGDVVTEDALRELQPEIRRMLDAVVLARDLWDEKGQLPPEGLAKFRVESAYFLVAFGDQLVVRATGTLRDRVLSLLIAALVTEPSDRVRRCLECGRLFVRVRRQTHCSRRCINRWTSRLYRERTGRRVVAEPERVSSGRIPGGAQEPSAAKGERRRGRGKGSKTTSRTRGPRKD